MKKMKKISVFAPEDLSKSFGIGFSGFSSWIWLQVRLSFRVKE